MRIIIFGFVFKRKSCLLSKQLNKTASLVSYNIVGASWQKSSKVILVSVALAGTCHTEYLF